MPFDLMGFDDVANAMSRAADAMSLMKGSRGTQNAIKKVCQPLIHESRGNLPKESKRLKPAIQAYIRIDPVMGNLAEVGISYKRSRNAHHAHLVEGGHETCNQHGGPYRRTPEHPFWEPAVEATKDEVLARLEILAGTAVQDGWRR